MTSKLVLLAVSVTLGLVAQQGKDQDSVVRAGRCDGGATARINLDHLQHDYEALGKKLALVTEQVGKVASRAIDDGYDSGLPEPAGRTGRIYKPADPLPEKLRGLTFHVVAVDKDGSVRGLPKGRIPSSSVVLVARAARLRDVAQFAPLTLLTRELAASLGIRTSRCRATVNEAGTEVEITEGDEP